MYLMNQRDILWTDTVLHKQKVIAIATRAQPRSIATTTLGVQSKIPDDGVGGIDLWMFFLHGLPACPYRVTFSCGYAGKPTWKVPRNYHLFMGGWVTGRCGVWIGGAR